jgi:DNA repair exonuclease SbcCD nuclease subunit
VDTKWGIFTDLHLGIHQNRTTWHNIALDWADWFVKELKSKKIKQLIFIGDFFHSRSEISVNTIHAASCLLEKLKDFKIIMVVGNHDSFYKERADVNSLSILSGYSNITVCNKVLTLSDKSTDGKKIGFCPWGFEIDEVKKSDALFGHFEIETFKMNAHKLCEVGTKPKDLLNKSPLVFSGHFHHNEEREYKDGKIIYVGTPFQMDFGERDSKKGYYIIDFKDLTYEFYENNISPIHKKIFISEIIDKKVQIEHCIKDNFIKIVIDKKLDQQQIDNTLHACNSLKPISLIVDPLVNFDIMGDKSETDLSGVDITKAIVEFVDLLEIDNKEDVVKHTLYLYNQVKNEQNS